ncbi:MAG: hypothetical protein SP1CHLAM54_05690 [Chlamydiia bacterium]|nr:hypothetical protein [Chlamydiia bacterium]MCH9615479.1 hypothetical protein [Chlamydiia bacterium]MCH9629134.1 hypothetical protein [Chlamydiia bacterium]
MGISGVSNVGGVGGEFPGSGIDTSVSSKVKADVTSLIQQIQTGGADGLQHALHSPAYTHLALDISSYFSPNGGGTTPIDQFILNPSDPDLTNTGAIANLRAITAACPPVAFPADLTPDQNKQIKPMLDNLVDIINNPKTGFDSKEFQDAVAGVEQEVNTFEPTSTAKILLSSSLMSLTQSVPGENRYFDPMDTKGATDLLSNLEWTV